MARYEAAGKRKYLYGKTKKIVIDRLRERRPSGLTNLVPEADTMLVGSYLDRWLPTVRGTVEERTITRHEEVVAAARERHGGDQPPEAPEKGDTGLVTLEEAKRLLRVTRAKRFEALYVLVVTTGMRQGELLGLGSSSS